MKHIQVKHTNPNIEKVRKADIIRYLVLHKHFCFFFVFQRRDCLFIFAF